jgi:SAM-dependent methyltransferase
MFLAIFLLAIVAVGDRVMSNNFPRHSGWDAYWARDRSRSGRIYAILASIYRYAFICPRLAYSLRKTFPVGSKLLHAGCGGGEVDALVSGSYRITGLDISPGALQRYRQANPRCEATIHADLLQLDGLSADFDGVYSLGVLEHFTESEIAMILGNLRKVLKTGGKMIAFWPLQASPSVKVLGLWHRYLNRAGDTAVQLHPPELSLIQSRQHVEGIIKACGWELISYNVSPLDLYVQAVIVCE